MFNCSTINNEDFWSSKLNFLTRYIPCQIQFDQLATSPLTSANKRPKISNFQFIRTPKKDQFESSNSIFCYLKIKF